MKELTTIEMCEIVGGDGDLGPSLPPIIDTSGLDFILQILTTLSQRQQNAYWQWIRSHTAA